MATNSRRDDEWEASDWEVVANRPQWFTKEPQRISNVLSQLLSRRGYGQIQAAMEVERLWAQAIPARLAKDCKPGQFRNGTLDVLVRNSAVMQELTFQSNSILRKLNDVGPQFGVKKLRMRVSYIG